MNVFLPIRPVYAERIFRGTKRVEFRRYRFARKVKRVIVYAGLPVRRILGYFSILRVDSGRPVEIWDKYSKYGGVDRAEFFDYYAGCDTAYAYVIGEVWAFEPKVSPFEVFDRFIIPQSYKYLSDDEYERLLACGLRARKCQPRVRC